MFALRPQPRTRLDDAIDSLLVTMSAEPYESEDYGKMLKHLTELYKLKENSAPKRPSPDTVLLVAGNLAGIVIIIGYERANVIASKAIGFVLRLR
jgi:hypothetical protein